MTGIIIHKRQWDRRQNAGLTWAACNPEVKFGGPEYSFKNPAYAAWEVTNNYSWKNVTCPACLALRKQNKNGE